jgi:hypothetical protein
MDMDEDRDMDMVRGRNMGLDMEWIPGIDINIGI